MTSQESVPVSHENPEPDVYTIKESSTSGSYTVSPSAKEDFKVSVASKEEGLLILKRDAHLWEGLWCFEKEGYVPDWALVHRGSGFKPQDGDDFTYFTAKFCGPGAASFTDEYCESILRRYQGTDITQHYKRIGRGEDLCDEPGLALFGTIDPCDVQQRGIGDCWLMCSIAACAEFDGLISGLFEQKQLSREGRYTIRLFDLPSEEWKEYAIDDRLQACPEDGSKLRFADLSTEKEIWCPLLEKAFAVHAGGWDKIEGGVPQVGLACLTGCRETFQIRNYAEAVDAPPMYRMAKFEWNTFRGNNAYDSGRLVGHAGFKGQQNEVDADVLFEHLCEWDEKNFLVCAGTGGKPGGSGSHDNTQDGIADSHVSVCSAASGISQRPVPYIISRMYLLRAPSCAQQNVDKNTHVYNPLALYAARSIILPSRIHTKRSCLAGILIDLRQEERMWEKN